jgi:farnesyl diphosphate synthase
MSRAAVMLDARPSGAFAARLDATAAEIDRLLDRLLSIQPLPGELARPRRLLDALRYASLGGGKRLRPFLVAEAAALFSVPRERALLVGAAIECVHGYSLVHDDLPALDDDAVRRGRPTLHRAFDEATAILAGDSLLTFAFDVLAQPDVHPDAAVRIALVGGLARAAGFGGVAGGQMLDLAAEGRFSDEPPPRSEADVVALQAMKTGALIRFSCVAGGLLGGASAGDMEALGRYGQALGQAFQIADDLLDVDGDANTMGKATGKDAPHGKATLVGMLGRDGARLRLTALVAEAEGALTRFAAAADTLKAAARFVAARRS